MSRIFYLFLLVIQLSQWSQAEGIRCWIRCHHPPQIQTVADVSLAMRSSPNPPLTLLARSTGLLTTYVGKILGIQGWRDYHLRASIEGRVVQAAGSTDGLYTIDVQVHRLCVSNTPADLNLPSFIRIEVFPFARIGAPLPVAPNQNVSISGKLMWDADGFLEIHPKNASDFASNNSCK